MANVRRDIAGACARAGIPPCTPNDLRRTFGTWWREHEVEPHLIGSLLGHKDSRMVERVYGRMPVQSLGRALERRLPAEPGPNSRILASSPSSDRSTCAADSGKSERHMRPRRQAEPQFPAEIWCPGTELNRRHEDFQSSALPTELPGRWNCFGLWGGAP